MATCKWDERAEQNTVDRLRSSTDYEALKLPAAPPSEHLPLPVSESSGEWLSWEPTEFSSQEYDGSIPAIDSVEESPAPKTSNREAGGDLPLCEATQTCDGGPSTSTDPSELSPVKLEVHASIDLAPPLQQDVSVQESSAHISPGPHPYPPSWRLPPSVNIPAMSQAEHPGPPTPRQSLGDLPQQYHSPIPLHHVALQPGSSPLPQRGASEPQQPPHVTPQRTDARAGQTEGSELARPQATQRAGRWQHLSNPIQSNRLQGVIQTAIPSPVASSDARSVLQGASFPANMPIRNEVSHQIPRKAQSSVATGVDAQQGVCSQEAPQNILPRTAKTRIAGVPLSEQRQQIDHHQQKPPVHRATTILTRDQIARPASECVAVSRVAIAVEKVSDRSLTAGRLHRQPSPSRSETLSVAPSRDRVVTPSALGEASKDVVQKRVSSRSTTLPAARSPLPRDNSPSSHMSEALRRPSTGLETRSADEQPAKPSSPRGFTTLPEHREGESPGAKAARVATRECLTPKALTDSKSHPRTNRRKVQRRSASQKQRRFLSQLLRAAALEGDPQLIQLMQSLRTHLKAHNKPVPLEILREAIAALRLAPREREALLRQLSLASDEIAAVTISPPSTSGRGSLTL